MLCPSNCENTVQVMYTSELLSRAYLILLLEIYSIPLDWASSYSHVVFLDIIFNNSRNIFRHAQKKFQFAAMTHFLTH